jgi:hypothetical protein
MNKQIGGSNLGSDTLITLPHSLKPTDFYFSIKSLLLADIPLIALGIYSNKDAD